jgi:CHAD domain-containing protein
MPSLSQELAEKRAVALGRAQDAAKSARFRTLTVEVAAWLEAGRWTKPQDELIRDRGNLSVAVSAAEQLTRRWRKVRKKGKALAQLDARSRHKLRIQAKKLRYAAEFFSSVFTSKRAGKRRGQSLPPSSACRTASAISMTSQCTSNAWLQSAFAPGDQTQSAPSPPDC